VAKIIKMVMDSTDRFCLEEVLDKALHREPIDRAETLYLLGLNEAAEVKRLFATAQEVRRQYFQNKVFLYGFLYFSTWCRNDCAFCNYRTSNSLCPRYRKTDAEVIEAALSMAGSGVHLLDLTMGEDPLYYERENGFEPLLRLVTEIKRQTSLPIMVSPGAPPDAVLKELSDLGVEWYACYQETHNHKLFHQLRLNQNYDNRIGKKYEAVRLGLLIEEGILSGVGETLADVADSMDVMKDMGAHQIRVMNFVPQVGTPMQDFPPPPRLRELVIIAVFRLLFPDRLIPASLDVSGVKGLKEKLEAGANVVTSLILPRTEMVGVAQSTLDVSEGYRTVKGITPILHELGLAKADLSDYRSWIEKERQNRSTKVHPGKR
jgi:methylornithine synthase